MKVLHILDHSLPILSGYALRSQKILIAQRLDGLEACALTSPNQGPSGGLREEIDGIPYYRTSGFVGDRLPHRVFLREGAFLARFAVQIARVIRRERPDVIHAHSPSLIAWPAIAVARANSIPAVYEVRGVWEDSGVSRGSFGPRSFRYRMSRWFETKAMWAADAVTTLSEGLRDEVASRGIAPDKIRITPNGVDPGVFAPRARCAALSSKHGVDATFNLGYIGSFHDYEGLDLLVRAMRPLSAANPNIRLILVGEGEADDSLRRLARDLDLGERVVFTGRVPHDQVLDYYSILDVLVYPRVRLRVTEIVTALKPLEAMSMEKVVIASDVGGNRELVGHDVSGILFRAGDVECLTAAVLRAAGDADLRRRLGRAARATVIERRTWQAIVSTYTDLYSTLVGRRPPGAPLAKRL